MMVDISSPMSTKIRLVRCPNCRNILPELPEIPVYKCGGCGTMLQAKNRKNSINGKELGADETNPTQKYEDDSVSDSSYQEANLPFLQSSPGSDEMGVRLFENESPDFSNEKPGDETISGELPDSCELSCPENDNSSPEIREPVEQDEERSSLKQKIGYENCSDEPHRLDEPCYQNTEISSQRVTGEQKGPDKLHSSDELSYERIKSSTPGTNEAIKYEMGEDMPEQYLSRDELEHRDCKAENTEGFNFPANASLINKDKHWSKLSPRSEAHTDRDKSQNCSKQNQGTSQHNIPGHFEQFSENIESAGETSSSRVVACHKVQKPLIIAKAHTTIDGDHAGHLKSSQVEGSLILEKDSGNIAAQSPLNESSLSEIVSAYDSTHISLQQSQKKVQVFDRVSSADTFYSLPVIPRHTSGAMSKSPTRTYYGGDACESSYDGSDDIPDQPSHQYRRKFKAATDILSTPPLRRNDGFRAKNMQNIELDPELVASSSMFKGKNNYTMTERGWSELPEPRRDDHATRSTMRLGKDDTWSRMPYISRSSQLFYEDGSPSSNQQNVFQHYSWENSPSTTSYTEPDKLELLRMVYELEDKLKRTHVSEQMARGRNPAGIPGNEKHTPTSKHSRHISSFPRGVSRPQQYKVSRMGFSGQAAQYRHQVDCLGSHCCHQGCQCSTQLSSPCIHCSQGQYWTHPDDYFQNVYPAHSPSLQQYTRSQFSSWDHELKANIHKAKEHDMKRLYSREKHQVVKRHLRPLAGGAPITACFHCSELLQLPADFLLFKRRCHRLRCNSCNQILKFSLKNKAHLVPYVPTAPAPPPSEIDDNSEAANIGARASTSYSKNCQCAGPVSYSDNYEPSICRSCSTEGKHLVQKHTYSAISSVDSFRPMESREMISPSRKSKNLNKNSEVKCEAFGKASKNSTRGNSSSEIEELPPASFSPLHRLMGYSSASQVLFSSIEEEPQGDTRYREQQL